MSSSPSPAPSRRLEPAEVRALRAWWHRLQGTVPETDAPGGSPVRPSGQDRADLAELRRCASLTEVACSAAFGRVARALKQARGGSDRPDWQLDRLALVVGVVARLRSDHAEALPVAMRRPPKDGDPERKPVSEQRFRRLLTSPDDDDLFTGLRRVLPLVESRANLVRLSEDLFSWDDRVRKQWAYRYYDTDLTADQDAAD